MKKSLLALAALSAYAGVAQAKSSVTLYGIIDAGVSYINDVQVERADGWYGRRGKQLYGMSGIGLQQSRFGLRIVEDLGNGLKAVAVLENGFDINNGRAGQGGKLFGRQAFVGLAGDHGSVTFGRQDNTFDDFVGSLQASDRWGPQTAHPGHVDEGDRLNNSIKYTSGNYNGFSFGGAYSFGNVPGRFSENRVFAVGAGYKYGPLALGIGFLKANNPNLSVYGNNADDKTQNHIGNAGQAGVQGNTIYSGYASAGELQVIGGGVNYQVGPALLGLVYTNTKFKNLNDSGSGNLALTNPYGYTGSVTFHNAEARIDYQLTSALTAGVSYSYTRGNAVIAGANGAKYHQGNLGLDYSLSKRTDVYLIGSYQKASGTDSTALASRANIAELTPSNSPKQIAVRLGVRHKF